MNLTETCFRKLLLQNLGREPTIEEIAREAKMPVSEARRVMKISRHPISLDRPVVMGCSIGGRIVLHLALDYPERFRALIDEGAFLEWASYQGHLYGTSREAVAGPTREGFDLILEVEVQGARQLRERSPGAVFVFLIPPSLEVLEHRLRGRLNTDPDKRGSRLADSHSPRHREPKASPPERVDQAKEGKGA